MNKRTYSRDVSKMAGKEVHLCGWVHRVRDQKMVKFIILRDETGLVQLVHPRRGDDDDLAQQISSITAESAVSIYGRVVRDDRVKLGGVEVHIDSLKIMSKAESDLPITDGTGLDKRLDWRFLDLRRPQNRLIFEVQTSMEEALREVWAAEEFIEIHTPKLMASPSESGAELFRVEYFGQDAFLAQSPQFYKQMAMAAGFGKVFEIGPVFRANPSFTARHDTEFTSIDLEFSWVESHEDVMAFEERLLQHMLVTVTKRHGEDIHRLFGLEVAVPSVPFPRMSLEVARQIVAESGHVIAREFGDLDPEGERRVARHVLKELGHDFVFITDYPIAVRPFYHMRHETDHGLTKSFDLLWRGLEITTGAQREHRYDILRAQAIEKGLKPESLQFYLDFFRFGCPPHGGLGLGLTRLLMILLGIENVREVTFLYRGPNRLTP